MKRIPCQVALAALLCCVAAPLALAATPEETRLLGSDREEAQFQSLMPFTRTLATSGTVEATLAQSAAAAGVPPAAMVEALAAFGSAIDLERDLREGDRFYVRYERTYTAEGNAVGTGRVLWAELRTQAKGTLAIHRFRPLKASADSFWLSTGRLAATPGIRLPLDTITVSSGFGMRADPFDQPSWRGRVTPAGGGSRSGGKAAASAPAAAKAKPKAAAPPPPSPLVNPAFAVKPASAGNPTTKINAPTAAGLAAGLASPGTAPYKGFVQKRAPVMMMHEGVDLAADMGTPVRAAGDGVIRGAELKGGYGNWIEIEHDELKTPPPPGAKDPRPAKISTVYGHLLGFAAGIVPGARVRQGDIIGFVGSTGRSTGPHLHFEILQNGRPTNPMISQTLRAEQLKGGELERFKRTIARDLRERQNEAGPL